MQFNMSLTNAACLYIGSMLDKNQDKVFRLSVKKSGCSGYAYWPHMADCVDPNDTVFEIKDGLSIYIDTAWLSWLDGLRVDYTEEKKAGLKQKRLVFMNAKEGGRCGCGESFNK